MTDEEWEAYKVKFNREQGIPYVPSNLPSVSKKERSKLTRPPFPSFARSFSFFLVLVFFSALLPRPSTLARRRRRWFVVFAFLQIRSPRPRNPRLERRSETALVHSKIHVLLLLNRLNLEQYHFQPIWSSTFFSIWSRPTASPAGLPTNLLLLPLNHSAFPSELRSLLPLPNFSNRTSSLTFPTFRIRRRRRERRVRRRIRRLPPRLSSSSSSVLASSVAVVRTYDGGVRVRFFRVDEWEFHP